MEKATPLHGEVEVDESYFGGKRKGKRGRGAKGKVPVFGLLKRGGRVYTLPIPNAKAKTLMPIIESRVVPDSIVYTDSFASYDVLDVSWFHRQYASPLEFCSGLEWSGDYNRAMLMETMRRWWWPAFVFVYPLLFWPHQGGPSLDQQNLLRIYFSFLALIGGALLEWFAHPEAHLSHFPRVLRWFRQNPPALVALLYGVWPLVASAFAPYPALSLTGSSEDHSDGAIMQAVMSAIFLLVYLRARLDRGLFRRVLGALVGSALVLSLLAAVEVFTARPLVFDAPRGDLPLVTFPGKGHLAGYLSFSLSAAAGLGLWWAVFLAAFAVGLTYNRSAVLSSLLGGFYGGWRQPRRWLVVLALVSGLGLGWLMVGRVAPGGQEKDMSNPQTLEARFYFWRAAARGIAARPVTGWGGGQFYFFWARMLSDEELKRFFALHDRELIEYHEGLMFLVKNKEGRKYIERIYGWKAHNQFLDVGLMWGLVGLFLYLALLFYTVPSALRGNPAAVAILAYHVFLLFWFLPEEALGGVWVVWALAVGRRGVQS